MKMSFSSKELAKYWDNRAKEMNFGFQEAPSTQVYKRSEIELFKKYFKRPKGKKLLKLDLWNEVNNTGILFWAYDQGYEIYGLDIAPFTVEQAKKNFKKENKKATFIESDIREINFPDNSFDYLYTMGTIEHIPDYDKAIEEIYRVLKPKGKAIIGVPNLLDPFLRPLFVWFLDKLEGYPYSPEKAFTISELHKEVMKQNFKLIDATGILFMPGIVRMADVFLYKHLDLTWFFNFFEYFERRFKTCKRMGYLIAIVVEKNG